MSAVMTREVYDDLKAEDPRLLARMEKSPKYKAVIVAFRQEDKADAVEAARRYQSGENFTILGKSLSFVQVVEIAMSKATYQVKNPEFEAHSQKFPMLYARAAEAWTVLNLVQEGLAEQGVEFSKTTDSLRAIVEAAL